MRIPKAPLLAAVLSAPLVAQNPPETPPPAATKPGVGLPGLAGAPGPETPRGAQWRHFLATQSGRWWSRWSPATGTPREILGSGLPIADWREDTLDEARRHSWQVLQEHHELLGLGDCDFREVIGARMGQTWALVYEQSYRGLPVIDGRADVRVHRTGRVSMFGSTAFPIPADFDTTPALGELEATRIAWQQVGFVLADVPQPGEPRKPRLCIWGDVHAASPVVVRLAWEIPTSNVGHDGQGPIGRYYVDARNGEVLHYTNDKHSCGLHEPGNGEGHGHDGGGEHRGPADAAPPTPTPPPVLCTGTVWYWVRPGLAGDSPISPRPAAGIAMLVTGVGTVFTDGNGDYSFSVPAGTPVAITSVTDGGRHNGIILGAGSPNTNAALVPGANPLVTLLSSAATDAQIAHTTANYWIYRSNELLRSILGTTPQLVIADTIQPYVNDASTCDAYYTGNTLHFYGAGNGCNNTAFSTVIAHEWGHGIDDRYGGISNTLSDGLSEAWGDTVAMYLTDQPIVGQSIHTDGSSLRNGVNTILYGTVTNSQHRAGMSFMGFAWILRERLAADLGNRATAIAITNDIVLGSIPANATDQPGAVTEIFLADDDDGNLTNLTPHSTELLWACQQKGLPDPLQSQPANDDCADAIEVTNGLNGPFSTNLALNSPQAWNCVGSGGKDVWFRYLGGSGPLTVSVCGHASFDSVIEVYRGGCNSLQLLGCNDDACGLQSSVTVNLPIPGYYYLRVGGYNNQSGPFLLDVSGQAGVLADKSEYGAGCILQSRSFYEAFATAAAFDLGSGAMTLVRNGTTYVAQSGGTFVAPPPHATILALGDDAEVPVALPATFPYPGGGTTTLQVCSNGFVSAAAGNGVGYNPTATAWLASPQPRWGTWKDFNPGASGSGGVKFHTTNNVAYVTWAGVYGFQNTSPSTWQLQFHLTTGNVVFAWQSMSPLGAAMLVGYAAGGSVVDPGNRDLSATWPGTFQTAVVECTPLQLAGNLPVLGSYATMYVQALPANAQLAALLLSYTPKTSSNSLAGLGMPGCLQHVDSVVATEILLAAPPAASSYNLGIPYQPTLMGLDLFLQGFAFAPGVNALGVVASNGLQLTVGF